MNAPGKFLTQDVLQHIEDQNNWIVKSKLTFSSTRFHIDITVPPAFETDLASVPRFAWWFAPPAGPHIVEAATIHDWLYWNAGYYSPGSPIAPLTRMECDRILSDAMQACGASWFERHVVYWAVRLGGWLPWRKDAARRRAGKTHS